MRSRWWRQPGRKPKYTPAELENLKLRRENEKLRKELEAARVVIDVLKNVSALLGIAPREHGAVERETIEASVTKLAPTVRTTAACKAHSIPRTTAYRCR